MWARNGDEISKQYAGTGSTCTEVTINDKTSIKGKFTHKMTSIERFFKNNINSKDDVRQDCIDLVTGQHKKSQSMAGQEVELHMHEQQHEYSDITPYTICVFSWNLAGNEPRYEMDFTQVFKSEEFHASPDVVIIGFQETVVLNALNCLKGHDKARVDTLRDYAVDALADLDPRVSYTFVTQCAMVGILTMMFCKEPILSKISDVHTTKVKTGFGGNMGNKGAWVIRFKLEDTSVIACCTHLESGQKKEKERLQQLKDIVTTSFAEKGAHYKFMKHDVKIFFGDMNFRINLPYSSVISTIDDMTASNRDESMSLLLNNDQLNQNKADFPWLYCFKEMPISFLPTYKYDKGWNVYDTSKKLRIPSWTDRILWFHDEKHDGPDSKFITPLLYERRESLFSDHRPVVAYFEVNAHSHNVEKKISFKQKVVGKRHTIVEKPIKTLSQPQVKQTFSAFDEFSLFDDFKPGKKEEHIHLDLDFTKSKSKEETKNGSDVIEDLLNFDNNLIEIKEKKNDDNLIDFSTPSNKPAMGFAGHRPFHQHPIHSHSMGVRAQPIPGMNHGGIYHHAPPPTFQPMMFNTTSPQKHRASVPRKPSADLIEKKESFTQPQKKPISTEDYFNF